MALIPLALTFECPRCGTTEEISVSADGRMQGTQNGIGMAFSFDQENPRESTILCGCSQDDGEEAMTEMRLISEREL